MHGLLINGTFLCCEAQNINKLMNLHFKLTFLSLLFLKKQKGEGRFTE